MTDENSAKGTALRVLKNQTASPGNWAGQQPSRTTEAFLVSLLNGILASITETGSFNMKQLDHRAGFDYFGVSNKELVIHAGKLAGRPVRNYRVAKLVVLSALINGAGFPGPATVEEELLAEFVKGEEANEAGKVPEAVKAPNAT
jgi:hypothetical protein